MRSRRKRSRRKINSNDQLIGCQICVLLRRVARQTMKITERNFSFAIWPADAHDRIERSQRDTHVARVRCDALLALAKNRMDTVVALECAAAAAGFAFVACRERGIVKIITARPLQKIAA